MSIDNIDKFDDLSYLIPYARRTTMQVLATSDLMVMVLSHVRELNSVSSSQIVMVDEDQRMPRPFGWLDRSEFE